MRHGEKSDGKERTDSCPGPGGTTFTARKYVYDVAKGILTDIKLSGSVTTVTSDSNFNRTRIALPGGGVDSLSRGSLHEPIKRSTEAGSNNNYIGRWIGIDTLGRIDRHLRQAAKIGRWFTYDSLGRLRKGVNRLRTPDDTIGGCPTSNYGMSGSCTPPADYVSLDSTMYTYDAVGNRTDNSGAYSTGNRMTTFGNCTYTTDADGNVTARSGGSCAGAASFFWNAEGQLDSVQTGSTGIKYRYDAFGRLVQKRINGSSSSYFLWDGDNLLAELDGSAGAVSAEYSYYPGLDNLHALIKGGTRYYARLDGLGNVLALTDSAKAVKRTYTYDDWGQLTTGSDSASFNGVDRARWKGALWMGPEVELYYMRNRWYEPATGRFLSEDPIGLSGGINNYAFADDDPIGGRDPLGLQGQECTSSDQKTCLPELTKTVPWTWKTFPWGYEGITDLGNLIRGWPGDYQPTKNAGSRVKAAPRIRPKQKLEAFGMMASESWKGCNEYKIEALGGMWALSGRSLGRGYFTGTIAAKQAPYRIYGKTVNDTIGLYLGVYVGPTFSSPNQPVRLEAKGEIFCATGVGLFRAFGN